MTKPAKTEDNKAFVAEIFQDLIKGDKGALLRRVAEKSRWTITGSCPVSGVFSSRQEFYEKALARITRHLKQRVRPSVLRILGDGDRVVVEWRGQSTSHSGLAYDNAYCWILKIEAGEIQEGTIYCDTELVTGLLVKEEGLRREEI